MADAARPSDVTYEDTERAVRYTSGYLRRLLIERHHIRASLANPGGSVILMGVAASIENQTDFSSVVGNDYHLDLLEAEQVVLALPTLQRLALLAWADGLSSRQAAEYFGVRPTALRKRRERAVATVAEEMSGAAPAQGTDSSGDGRQTAPLVGSEEGLV